MAASIDRYTHIPQCSPASVGLAQAHHNKLPLNLGPAHIIILTSVCTVAGLCIRRFFTVWNTSTTPSACILSIMMCSATNTPLRPIPLLKGEKGK